MSKFRDAAERNREVMIYRIFIARRDRKQYSEAEYIDLVNQLTDDQREEAYSELRQKSKDKLEAWLKVNEGVSLSLKQHQEVFFNYIHDTYENVKPNPTHDAVRRNMVDTQIRIKYPQRRSNIVQEEFSIKKVNPKRKDYVYGHNYGGRKIRGKKRRTRRHHTRRRRRRRCASYTKKFY